MRLIARRPGSAEPALSLQERICLILPPSYQDRIGIKEIIVRLQSEGNFERHILVRDLTLALNNLIKHSRVRLAVREKKRFFGLIRTYRTEYFRVMLQSVSSDPKKTSAA